MEHIVAELQKRGIEASLTEHEVTGEPVIYFVLEGTEYTISADDGGYLHVDVYDPKVGSSYFRYDLWTRTLTRIYGSSELPESVVEAL
jgi:hypothetical protein